MKIVIALSAGTLLLAASPPAADAHHETRQVRSAKAKAKPAPVYRSTTTQANGLCQRDTGKPSSDLNFRDKCDVEEFWNRMDRGGGFRR